MVAPERRSAGARDREPDRGRFMESLSVAGRPGTAPVPLLFLLASLGCGVVFGAAGCGRSAPDEQTLQVRAAPGAVTEAQLTRDGATSTVTVARVPAGFFSTRPVQALLGRTLRPDDAREGAAPVAIISHALWQSRFGASPTVIGMSVEVDGISTTVVGVMPTGFEEPDRVDLWLPREER